MEQKALLQTLAAITEPLEKESISYCLLGPASLSLQGVNCRVESIEVAVQWDAFEKVAEYFSGDIEKHNGSAAFGTMIEQSKVVFHCDYNTVVMTDPDRILIQVDDQSLWVKAWDYYLRHLDEKDVLRTQIKEHLRQMQEKSTEAANIAWNRGAYDAWVNRFGTTEKWAEKILRAPETRLSSLKPYIGDVKGKKIINLMGSHGTKGIALAKLGAEVTIVDISVENARYAREVAKAAGVDLDYIVSDVLHIPDEEINAGYNLVFMELGILHYFIDLEPLVAVIRGLLSPGGRVVIQDFHPVSTKLLTSKGRKHKVTGDYFDKTLVETKVAFSKYEQQATAEKVVFERKWTLGEIVTAMAEGGFIIKRLDESPNIKVSDIGIPKTFTLVAEKL